MFNVQRNSRITFDYWEQFSHIFTQRFSWFCFTSYQPWRNIFLGLFYGINTRPICSKNSSAAAPSRHVPSFPAPRGALQRQRDPKCCRFSQSGRIESPTRNHVSCKTKPWMHARTALNSILQICKVQGSIDTSHRKISKFQRHWITKVQPMTWFCAFR